MSIFKLSNDRKSLYYRNFDENKSKTIWKFNNLTYYANNFIGKDIINIINEDVKVDLRSKNINIIFRKEISFFDSIQRYSKSNKYIGHYTEILDDRVIFYSRNLEGKILKFIMPFDIINFYEFVEVKTFNYLDPRELELRLYSDNNKENIFLVDPIIVFRFNDESEIDFENAKLINKITDNENFILYQKIMLSRI